MVYLVYKKAVNSKFLISFIVFSIHIIRLGILFGKLIQICHDVYLHLQPTNPALSIPIPTCAFILGNIMIYIIMYALCRKDEYIGKNTFVI